MPRVVQHPLTPNVNSRRRVAKSKSATTQPGRTLKRTVENRSGTPATGEQSQIQGRIRDVLCREIAFIHSREFNRKDADAKILVSDVDRCVVSESKPAKAGAVPDDLPAYFAALYEHELLSADQEAALFRKMNYLKFRANALRSALKPRTAQETDIDEIERLLARALQARDEIITSNLRLVVALARKYSSSHHAFEDLLSEGNVALIRAIEKFDYTRGFRFSTYATHAIQRDFFRQLNRQQKEQSRLEYGIDEFADDTQNEADEDAQAAEEYRRYQALQGAMQSELDARDRRVLMLRFGLNDGEEPQTLKSIGAELGLSKERVRQLEIRAIEKLKQHVEDNR